jgi:ABC-type proline/glycine betaine transport system substrate-binding protein
MERKEKKSNPTQLIIDGAAYFIVISSVLYVIYTSMGSNVKLSENVKAKSGWTVPKEMHRSPKPQLKSSWSLFAGPAESTAKASGQEEEKRVSASNVISEKQASELHVKTKIVSEMQEPIQTEAAFDENVLISDQEEEEVPDREETGKIITLSSGSGGLLEHLRFRSSGAI